MVMTTRSTIKTLIANYWFNNGSPAGQSLYWNLLSGDPESWSSSTTEGYILISSQYRRLPFPYSFSTTLGNSWDWGPSSEDDRFKNPTSNNITYGYVGLFNTDTRATTSGDYFNQLQFYAPITVFDDSPPPGGATTVTIPANTTDFEPIYVENTLNFGE
jgi:hypothetical protein